MTKFTSFQAAFQNCAFVVSVHPAGEDRTLHFGFNDHGDASRFHDRAEAADPVYIEFYPPAWDDEQEAWLEMEATVAAENELEFAHS